MFPPLPKGFKEKNSMSHEKLLQPQPFLCMVVANWILHPSFLFQVTSNSQDRSIAIENLMGFRKA
jgi:hypothetical protein